MGLNDNLHKAKNAKNDEFYTQLTDIEKELKYYKNYFEGKTVFCNCDDPEWSNFWKFFQYKFYEFGLKKLISTHFQPEGRSYKLEIVACEDKSGQLGIPDYIKTPLHGNGDFRSEECIEILQECDIIVTNPPFSKFREFMSILMKYEKKFLILGNQNAITYKEIFPLIKENKLWYGASIHSGGIDFRIPDNYEEYSKNVFIKEGHHYINLAGIRWFTNLDYPQRHEDLILYKNYSPEEYLKYDNYDAINVDKTSDIPCDYVPCWFKCNHACSCEWAQNSGFSGQALCEIEVENSVVAGTERNGTERNGCSTSQNKPSCCVNAAEESWECQSLSSTSSIQSNSKLLDSTDIPFQNNSSLVEGLQSVECQNMRESSYEEKCNGAIGVPITFLDKYNPDQFEILNANDIRKDKENTPAKQHGLIKDKDATITRPVSQSVSQSVSRAHYVRTNCHQEETTSVDKQRLSLLGQTAGILAENASTQEYLFAEKKCNGIMGVPITFLDKYNPEQFEIIELGNSRDNFTPNKDYINPKKHMKDGKIVNGGAINCVLAIEQQDKPINTVFYTSDNSKYLVPPYARILIRRLSI